MLKFLFSIGLLLLLFICASSLHAQDWADPQGTVEAQLMGLLQQRYGSDFQYVGFSILDSLLSHSLTENDYVRDPYGTLKGCVLFSTYKEAEDTFVVGMMRNGKIIWDNAPGSKADLGGDLLYAQDINNDGEVDLLVLEIDREFLERGREPFLYYLHILSWNGVRGRVISAEDNNAMMGDGLFELSGKNKDGIREIEATLPNLDLDWGRLKTNTFPHITYTWNGTQYGFWPGHKPEKARTIHKK